MASIKAVLAQNAQKHLARAEWNSAIQEMEKLFAVAPDPLIRVRIGNAHLKLNGKAAAVREYLRAAELFAADGFIAKALAQCSMALRLDPSSNEARMKSDVLNTMKATGRGKRGPTEYLAPEGIDCICDSLQRASQAGVPSACSCS
jgi:hypothetical protein